MQVELGLELLKFDLGVLGLTWGSAVGLPWFDTAPFILLTHDHLYLEDN
jgi:hypothetical protein